MKIALIINPYTVKIKNFMLLADKRLKKAGIQYDLFITQYHGHVSELIKNMGVEEYDGIVSAGGDGTNYHVLNGLLKYHHDKELPKLGIIPVGRGNSFAMDLGIHTIDDGFAALLRQSVRAVDVCCFTQGAKLHYLVCFIGPLPLDFTSWTWK